LFAALAIDLSIAMTVTLLLDYVLQGVIYIETFDLMFLVILLYTITAGLCRGKTAGRIMFGVTLTSNTGNNRSIKPFLICELLKYGILIAVPYLVFRLLGIVDSYAIFVDIVFVATVIAIFSFILFRKTLWSRLAQVNKVIIRPERRTRVVCFIALLVISGGGYSLIKHINNATQPSYSSVLGFHFPYKFPEYPNSSKLKPYVECLNNQESPKEYILNLFKKYDIVILQESYHGETTQWDMIGDIVADTAFINNVGHVFTEYGSAMHQDKIDTFLHTVFADSAVLEQETAILMDYMSGGFYYFIKRLNLINAKLPDSLKIQEHYTDVIDWDYFSTLPVTSHFVNRDSSMAQVTVDWYNRQLAMGNRHKCMVITNSRHAFGYAGGIEKIKNSPAFLRLTKGNQGQYIWEAFPDKTATVLQLQNEPSRSFFIPIYRPQQGGLWDKAFALTDNRPAGFDLKGTPFGKDIFGGYRMRGARPQLCYEDFFTGVIFNIPFMEQREIYHPYHRYAIEQEAIRKGISDSTKIRYRVRHHTDEVFFENNMNWAFIISAVNFIPILFLHFFVILSLLLSIIYLLWRVFTRIQGLHVPAIFVKKR
jgi:hypothetical protein